MATRIRDTQYKQILNSLKIGDEVEIEFIGGKFTLPENASKPLVFIAAGIGITPFIGMLRFVKEKGLPHKITLLYSNREKESAAFLEEFLDLEKINLKFKFIPIMTQDSLWIGEKRRIDENLIKEYFKEPNLNFYMIAGPRDTVFAIKESILKAGVGKDNIQAESFSGY